MKWILLLLLSFNIYAQSESAPAEPLPFCGLSTYEEIDACTIEDKLPTLVRRLYPSSTITTEAEFNKEDPCDSLTVDDSETVEVEVCPPWDQQTDRHFYSEQEHDDEGNPELSFYERLEMLDKPLESVFAAELLVWAAEKKVLVDWYLRVDAITRMRRAMVKCGYNQPNMALFKKSLVLNDPKINCLENKKAELDAEDEYAAAKAKRHDDRLFGDDLVEQVLLLIPGDLPASVKLPFLQRLSPIQSLLQLGDIDGAKEVITAEPVDIMFNQDLKDFMLGKISAYLGE